MESIVIYADGGCRGNGSSSDNVGAYGATLTYKGRTRELSGAVRNTTNNKMELTAVIKALQSLKRTDIPVEVYVDSAYVLNGITSWIHGWIRNGWRTSKKQPVENRELWEELLAVKNTIANIQFIKVKGHSGDVGNERADTLVNMAMDELEDQIWLENKGWN